MIHEKNNTAHRTTGSFLPHLRVIVGVGDELPPVEPLNGDGHVDVELHQAAQLDGVALGGRAVLQRRHQLRNACQQQSRDSTTTERPCSRKQNLAPEFSAGNACRGHAPYCACRSLCASPPESEADDEAAASLEMHRCRRFFFTRCSAFGRTSHVLHTVRPAKI